MTLAGSQHARAATGYGRDRRLRPGGARTCVWIDEPTENYSCSRPPAKSPCICRPIKVLLGWNGRERGGPHRARKNSTPLPAVRKQGAAEAIPATRRKILDRTR